MSNIKLSEILAICAMFTLTACSTPSKVTTADGQTVYTPDSPKTNTGDGFVTYQENGHQVKVNKSDIKKIEPLE